jgi:hypothetical protein
MGDKKQQKSGKRPSFEPEMGIKKQRKSGGRPSFKLELGIVFVLGIVALCGIINILGSYLSNAFNSIFGMGLK